MLYRYVCKDMYVKVCGEQLANGDRIQLLISAKGEKMLEKKSPEECCTYLDIFSIAVWHKQTSML